MTTDAREVSMTRTSTPLLPAAGSQHPRAPRTDPMSSAFALGLFGLFAALPTAMALRTERIGVVLRSSMASRKIQKKQNRARSKIIPREVPIKSENDACAPVPSRPERT
jgi:hypothetical protein